MSKIKLPHASGNSMSIGAPATNPASDLELKLPATVGTAGQVLKNSDTAGTLEFGPASRLHRNLIINGAMQVAQRGTAEVTAANDTNTYRADRFKFAENTAATVAMSIQDGTGEFAKCLKVRVTGTDTSVDSNDRASIQTIIEDLDVKHLQWGTANAESVTISFWVRSNAAQTYCLNLYNSGTNNRTYIAEYAISSADTWEKKTLTIPGDTTGTWGHIGVKWVLMGGSDKVGSAGWGAWSGSGGLEMQTSNQYNWLGATNDFHLTGVQLEVGDVATDFEHKSYGDELARCQRYYGTGGNSNGTTTYPSSDGYGRGWHDFKVQMRATPTMTFSDRSTGGSKIGDNINNGGFFVTYGSLGASQAGTYDWTASSEL